MGEAKQRRWVRALAAEHGIDMAAICREYAMSWDQIRAFGNEPLVTIGAHTVNHLALAKLDAHEMHGEITRSRDEIARQTRVVPEHFCYPYGDEGSAAAREFNAVTDAGFKTAVTTRKGLLYPGHESHLTALPRVSLNGDYQSLHYLDVFLSGVPFALWNRFRKVDAA
jgi:peptidoglycan/xylan/chitin deacetylase (PgdA/CDA1 family)